MRCPYCAEDIRDDAVICKHCRSELTVAKQLLEKIKDLNDRLEKYEKAAPPQTEVAAIPTAAKVVTATPAPVGRRWQNLSIVMALTATYITLIVAHLLIVVTFDASQVWLRLVSIIAPFTFGVLCRESEKSTLIGEFFLAIAVSAATVFSMLAIVAYLDKVPILPSDPVQWHEFNHYSASIAFGFFAGIFSRHMLLAIYFPNAKPNVVIEWIARFLVDQFSDGRPRLTLKAVRSIVSSVLGFGSAVISIITGMWQFLN